MPLQRISLLQIGDIHFPDLKSKAPLADVKDKAFPPQIAGRIVASRFHRVADSILRLLNSTNNPIHGVLLTGDLTSRGDLAGYTSCVQYLSEFLAFDDTTRWKNRTLVVIPGNHDVERPALKPVGNILDKFNKAKIAWDKHSIGAFHFQAPQSIDVNSGNCHAVILPLNTCLGCGEYRLFPEQIREDMVASLLALGASLEEMDRFELLGERLDTPAISDEDIQALRSELRSAPKEAAIVVVGHHPFLAQPLPRIDTYAELINAGQFRRSLLESHRNIVYVHGHIHQDPVESVSTLDQSGTKILSVSAPEFSDGFNVLNIYFSSRDTALGIEVVPYRFRYGPDLERLEATKTCLVSPGEVWNEISEPIHESLLSLLNSPSKTFRFDDLVASLKKTKALRAISGLDTHLAAELEVLEMLGVVGISNQGSIKRNWQVRRIAP